jgi:hypothetical protein
MRSVFVSSETVDFSFWRPSRGPTSTTVARSLAMVAYLALDVRPAIASRRATRQADMLATVEKRERRRG